ncbi:MAG: DUF533 domain-containing protein [Vicinamibacterales bacterium]
MSIDLVGAVLRGVLGGRRKRSRKASSYLGRGGGGLINANTILTAAGLAWGAYESWQASQSARAGAPVTPSRAAGIPPIPPIPGSVPGVVPASDPVQTVRLMRLAMAAANADGSLTEPERTALAARAREAGASEALVNDLSRPAVLADIVAGVSDAREKATLYVLAFTIVRADEQVSGSERIFLAQLANLLGLDPQVVSGLEKSVADSIDAETV